MSVVEEEHTACTFKATKLVQVGAKCCSDRKCSGYILEVLREYSHHSCGRRL